jgi:secreted trypsin-like serine protease
MGSGVQTRHRGRSWPRLIALVLAAAALCGPTLSHAAIRAVFVGIDTYANSHPRAPGPAPQVHDLQDSVTDLTYFKKAITAHYDIAVDPGPDAASRRCDWRTATSITLVNACATRTAVLSALSDQVAQAQAGDAILFFFSGLGSTLTPPGATDVVGSLVPVDGRDPVGAVADISMREVEALEDQARAKGAKLYSVLDACQPSSAAAWDQDDRAAPYRPGAAIPSTPPTRIDGEPTRTAAACFGGDFDGEIDGVTSSGFVSALMDDIAAGKPAWLPTSQRRQTALAVPDGAAVCMRSLQLRGVKTTQEDTSFVPVGQCQAVVGGVPVKPGEAPWMVELQYAPPFKDGVKPIPTVLHNCGAALVRADWVITAAHCLADADNIVDPNEIPKIRAVRMGSLDLNGPMSTYRITRAIVHPSYCNSAYDPATGHVDDFDPDPCPMTANDIALLHITPDPAVGVGPHSKAGAPAKAPMPVTLTDLGTDEPDQEPVKVVGWGASSAANSSAHQMETKLQIADLKIVDSGACASRIADALRRLNNAPNAPTSYDQGLPPSVVCAGVDDNSIDSCQGDSGGPLVALYPDGAARLIGVVSEGPSCAAAPGIYTKVSYFRGWINQVMAQMETSP